MNRFLALALVAAIAMPAAAQEPPQAATYRDRSGSYQSAQGTFCIPARDGSGCPSAASGPQPSAGSQSVTPASDAAFPVIGNVAGGTADSGNPVKVGGVFRTGVPLGTVPNGARVAMNMTKNGSVRSFATGATMTSADGLTNAFVVMGRDDIDSDGGTLPQLVFNGYFNPATTQWNGQRGDTTGTWTHAPASTPTPLSGTVTTSGTTVALTFTNTSDGEFANPSTATFWCSWGTPAVNGAGSYPILPNGSYRPPSRVAGTFTCLSTAASQAYTFTRF